MSSAATPVVVSSTAPTTAATTQKPLPSAQTFDILPPLHQLLSKLEPSLNAYTGSAAGSDAQQIAYKDVPLAAQFLKTRIRKALAELGQLDDMDRSVEEQDEEIEYLLERISKQKQVLAELADMAGDIDTAKHNVG